MKIHIVKEGDTLYELSQKYQVDLNQLIEQNPHIADPDELDVGMKVKIPTSPVPVGYKKDTKDIKGIKDSTLSEITTKLGKMKESFTPSSNKFPSSSIKKGIDSVKSMASNPLFKKDDSKVEDSKVDKVDTLKAEAQPLKEAAKPLMETAKPLKESAQSLDEIAKPLKATVKPHMSKKEDLFEQYKTPATKVGSFYDMPDIHDIKDTPWGMPYKSKDQEDIPGLEPQLQPDYMQQHGLPMYPQPTMYPQNAYAPMPNMMPQPMYNAMPNYMPNYMPECSPVEPTEMPYSYAPSDVLPYGMPYYQMPCGTPAYNLPYMPQFPKECNCNKKRNNQEEFNQKEDLGSQRVTSGKAKIRNKNDSKHNVKKMSPKPRKKVIKNKEALPWINK